jgi:UDP-N-acetylmuramate--alanine ligase
MQPHRYSRLRDLLAEFEAAFNDADGVFVTPVYAAGEDPIPGVDSEALVAGLKERGHRSARTVASEDELAALLGAEMAEGDMIVCLGAGDITKWAARLPEKLEGARA